MPELPDLLYIRARLQPVVTGRTITGVTVRQPVVLRVVLPGPVETTLTGRTISEVDLHGPFLLLRLSNAVDIVLHLMLAGRLQHQTEGEPAIPFLCFSLLLNDGTRLHVGDEQKMAKVYVVPRGEYGAIPKFATQGIPVLSRAFTEERFRTLAAAHRRKQVRVFLNDQTALSAIGNAYADEILFEARVHPKTFVGRLSPADLNRLHAAIGGVLTRGCRAVEAAAQPIHRKIRDHMLVRNRHGEPCPRCGTTIRREGVRGYDVFFCPSCQPPTRTLFLDWRPPGEG
jgi:formamidopyrimidine-DNA glycosylase